MTVLPFSNIGLSVRNTVLEYLREHSNQVSSYHRSYEHSNMTSSSTEVGLVAVAGPSCEEAMSL